ncbi:hypothetical protein G9A89_014164 [Geosiphon pyriformis]|nr:hypothetical protein G9A89_014164 [Geosiphon pyriformis]
MRGFILSVTQYSSLEALQHVIAVGHNLGGVHVLLGMLELIALNLKQNINVYTFGKPRVGNRQFTHYVNSLTSKMRIHRITNMDDYVPRLPPSVSFYTHTMLEYWIEADDCLCFTGNLFLCAGPVSGRDHFIEESQPCNNQYSTNTQPIIMLCIVVLTFVGRCNVHLEAFYGCLSKTELLYSG